MPTLAAQKTRVEDGAPGFVEGVRMFHVEHSWVGLAIVPRGTIGLAADLFHGEPALAGAGNGDLFEVLY